MSYLKFIILIFIVFPQCMSPANEKSAPSLEKSVAIINRKTDVQIANTRWVENINSKSDSIDSLYSEDAVKILGSGKTVEGREQIKDYLFKQELDIKTFQSDTVIVANEQRGLEYEIAGFTDKQKKSFKSLIIWERKNSVVKRVFEFTEEVGKTEENLGAIEARRNLWMRLCNEHNAANLVKELYSTNTLYFNHKPVLKGHQSVIQDYQYMNDENYQLALHPIFIEPINKEFVFEIGQCEGSYNGKYILIWRKEENNKWNVFIDSNI